MLPVLFHASISGLLFVAPFAACLWAAAGAGLGRERGEDTPSDSEVPAPLPSSEDPTLGAKEKVVRLNQRLASLDEQLSTLATTNRHLVNVLRSCTAQLCLSQDEMALWKIEVECARLREAQFEATQLEHGRERELLGEEVRSLQETCAGLSARAEELAQARLELDEARARIAELEETARRRAAPHAELLLPADELAEGRILAHLKGLTNRPPTPLPTSYFEGLEAQDLARACAGLFGSEDPLSEEAMLRLSEHWQRQHATWRRARIDEEVVYLWAEGRHVRCGLGAEGEALLVLVAGCVDGSRRVVCVETGLPHSADAWFAALETLVQRGMNVPRLVIAEERSGLWPALERVGWNCARSRIQDRRIEDGVGTAADRTLELDAFPAQHRTQLRSANLVGPLLAALGLRARQAQPSALTPNACALYWKLVLVGTRRMRRIPYAHLLAAVALRGRAS
ncbi:MAG: transposase [Planctomycetes bacterium]|nr:transposase [Planctomycetota bacterium]